MSNTNLAVFTDVLGDEIGYSQESQPLSLSSEHNNLENSVNVVNTVHKEIINIPRPAKRTGQNGEFRSVEEIHEKYRDVFCYPFFNIVQSSVIEDALYSDKSMVVSAPTGSGKTVVFEMAIVQLLMELEDKQCNDDFKIIYMAPVKALCTERLTEWYPKFTKLGLMCIEVTGDTNVDFTQLKPYRIIITTPEKWDMVTRRWREHRQLVEVIKLFLIDEVHILNDECRGPVLEAVVSRMKTIESSAQSAHRIEQLQNQYRGTELVHKQSPQIRFIAVSATVSNPEDVAAWLGGHDKPAVYYKFGDESRPVKLKRVVEGYPCPEGTSIFKFDIILNYKLRPVIQKYHNGKPTLIFCNTRKSVALTAETLSKELTISFDVEQKAKLTALASKIKNKKLQALVLNGVGCHHAGLLFEERISIENAFRNRDLPILITTTTLAMGVNLPAHLVIIKNTQQYVNGAYQEYSISTILQMVGRAGRPQYDTEATAVIMTRLVDKPRYQALVGGSEPLQSYLHKRIAENLNSEAALCTVNDVAQCVQWLRSTFLYIRAAKDPRRYLGLPNNAPQQLISKKLEELCVKAMNGLATSGLITMDEASCIESTEAGRLMSIFYLDVETMKLIMKITGTETLDRLLWLICESHELADMHLRVDERRCLNLLNRNNAAATIRFPMKGKISTRQMKLNCVIQAILGCLPIPDPSLNQEAMKIMRIAERICKCLVAYVTRPALISDQPKFYSAVLNSLILEKCITSHLWENSPYVSKQLKGIGPTFSTLLATAGKVNFMVLEESHPRDLERIMNKGPPAGNVLRKQISLLPKYQLTMTPIDEKSVSIQLALLNQNYLAENVDNLTATDNHKAYLVVGDSENNLLLLTWFKDRDLLSVYDGTITHKITRKHSFEHKMFAECISSSFVGIDAHCEYVFKDLESVYSSHFENEEFIRPAIKQTVITDTFKERKRKNAEDITQSKEKKKRDSTLIEKFKVLKESFGKTSKELKEDLDKSTVMSSKILQELTHNQESETPKLSGIEKKLPGNVHTNSGISAPTISSLAVKVWDDEIIVDDDDLIDDENIDSILNDIENEISKSNDLVPSRVHRSAAKNTSLNIQGSTIEPSPYIKKLTMENNKPLNNPNRRSHKAKSNYNFIDALEEKMDLSLEDRRAPTPNTGFSETIKTHIQKYLEHTKRNFKVPDTITELIEPNDTTNDTGDVDCDGNVAQDQQILGSNFDINNEQYCIDVSQHNSYQAMDFVEGKDLKVYRPEAKCYEEYQSLDTVNINENVVLLDIEPTKDLTESGDVVQDDGDGINSNSLISAQNIYDNPNIVQDSELDIVEKDQSLNNDNMSLVLHDNHNLMTSMKNSSQHLKNYLGPTAVLSKHPENQKESVGTSYATNECQPHVEHIEPNANIISTSREINQSQLSINDRPSITPTFISDNNSNSSNTRPIYTKHNAKDILNRNHNEKIRKYSYSNTKIDVASTSTDDSVIQVIRKIKMDLDITEIISERKKDNDEHVDTQEESHNEQKRLEFNLPKPFEGHTNLYRNKQILVPHYGRNTRKYDKVVRNTEYQTPKPLAHNKNQLETVKKATCNKRYMRQRDNIMSQSLEFKSPRASEFHHEVGGTTNALVLYSNKIKRNHEIVKDKIPEHFISGEGIKTAQIQSFRQMPQNEAAKTSVLEKNDISNNLDKKNSKTEEIGKINNNTETNENSEPEGNKVNHILRKYSKILGKTNKNTAVTPSQPRIADKVLSQPKEKIKRPFKITHIHNIDAPLPKTLISEISKRESTLVIQNISEISKRESTHVQNIEEQKETPTQKEDQEVIFEHHTPQKKLEFNNETNYNEYTVQNATVIEDFNEIIPELQLPEITMVENSPEQEFNIDKTMFDPKMLLQSIGKDDLNDLIVPPPPEFGNETELSQEINNSLISTDCYEPMQWNHYENYYTTQESYVDESQVDFTPTPLTAVETWTLSQNDEGCDISTSKIFHTPTLSYQNMYENPTRRNSPYQTVASVTRQNKLGQFKFSGKKKFKL